MLQEVVTSFLAFISTNIDDLFVLMLFFGSGRIRPRDVFTGQYLGIAFLVIVSFVASLAGLFIDSRFIGLLGLFPIYLAVKQLVKLFSKQHEDESGMAAQTTPGILAIAVVTVANGGDNLGVYTPLLATLSAAGKAVFGMVFLVMVFVWCSLAIGLVRQPRIARTLQAYGHVIMPIVLLLLGLFILYESGAAKMLLQH
ncbi:MAG TPA: cadmium resistance transporter [Chryseolinea sp.]|nr:cadmium resistance transporter [Chryseolinea sp.]